MPVTVSVRVCVQKNNRDFLNPIKFQLTQQLQDRDQPMLSPGRRLPDIDDFPVLNATLAKNLLSVCASAILLLLLFYNFFLLLN